MTPKIARLAAALALALGCDTFAATQMYKCVESGRTVYQQQACNPQPQAQTATSAARPASAASVASSAAPKKLKQPSPASSAPATPR
jgi:hypothetical protein